MIILDTNVLSELTRPAPDPAVLRWLDNLPTNELAVTVVTAAELQYGVARLPDGQRKSALDEAVRSMIYEDLGKRVEPFDLGAADCYASMVAQRDRLGSPISVADAQIAAICLARNCPLATRNTKDFAETGVALINPWTDG